MMQASVIVPTFNAANYLASMAAALKSQTLEPLEWIVVDSASTDGTAVLAQSFGATVLTVDRTLFQHGRTRNLAAKQAQGDILVFMSQDAVPENPYWLERLTAPIPEIAAAAYARQIPRWDASPLERFARAANYPARSHIVTRDDVDRLGIRAFYFSNACSAVDRRVFVQLAGFPESTIMNEDMLYATRLLSAGYAIQYASDAIVIHSHAYGPIETFRRYFDIGVFLSQAGDELPRSGLVGEGARYALGLMRSLTRSGAWHALPAAVFEIAMKLAAQRLGLWYKYLPIALRRRFSMHPGYWEYGKG